MVYKTLIYKLIACFALSLFSFQVMAQANLDAGKALFKNNCASCHNKNMKDDLTGPALGGVQERWEGREELLYSWIRNSQAVIASGDPYAVGLFADWGNSVMTAFPNLTDEQIATVLDYIQAVNDGVYPKPVPGAIVDVAGTGGGKEEGSNSLLYVTLFLILAILAVVLAKIISNLNHMAAVKAGATPAARKSIMGILTGSSVVSAVIFGLVVIGGYMTINNATNLGRQQGYAPDQPIKFSHATHAGLQKIDCQYCHDGARRSKHSVIPAANTCMNCHKAIKKGSKYGTAELTKIYASVGYDPTNDSYIEQSKYMAMDDEDIAKMYKTWISDNFKKDNEEKFEGAKLESKATAAADDQWKDIVESLTDETTGDDKVQGPIEWVRIHNLPDHVYFNHAQHVTVGKIECQQCHGPVEEMEIMAQHSPLSMGWCINCHRETEVQFAGNEYYNSYENYHNEIKAGDRNKVTVEDIGGLECQKCHY
ncbi:MAG: c-type cytochrome [Saprospiraceae bacterium]